MPPADYATRLFIARQLRDLTADGSTSLRRACQQLDVALATGKLWLDKLADGSDLADARRERSGRKPLCQLTAAEESALRSLVLEHRMSEESAIRAFPKHPACTAATRHFILERIRKSHSGHRSTAKKERWPDSLRRAAHVTASDREHYYGPDAARAKSIPSQRRLTYAINGREFAMRPHSIWTFDDYSSNKPYYLEYAEGKFRCCRQILAGMDCYSHGWLSFLHVGKERDAYTASDALRVIHLTLESHETRPDVIILEQGRWKGNAIRGLDIGLASRWGDIQEAGFIVEYTHDSRGKAELEAGFHPLQIELQGGADIGHTRGLHERESDNYLAVNQGRRDPRLCGFVSLGESEAWHYQAAAALNARRKQRQELGYASADELFAEHESAPKRPLPAEHRWLFMPHKQEATVGSIGRSLVGCTVDGRKHFFVVNGIREDVHLDDGHKVLIAFDPERPALGCAIANADGSTKNRDGWRMGELLLGGQYPAAPSWETVPRIEITTDGLPQRQADEEHWKLRKSANKAAHTSFRSILPGGKRGLRVDSRRTRSGRLNDTVTGSEHADTNAAAELAAAYRGESVSNTAPVMAGTDAVECPPRTPRNGLPRVAGDSAAVDAAAQTTRHKRATAPVLSDAELEALEEAAMRKAGLLI